MTVVDGWQQRGVGTALVAELAAQAVRGGITTFSADALAVNRGALALARSLGDLDLYRAGRGIVSLEVKMGQADRRRSRAAGGAS